MPNFKRSATAALIVAVVFVQSATPTRAPAQSIALPADSSAVRVEAAGEVLRALFIDLRATVGTGAGLHVRYERKSDSVAVISIVDGTNVRTRMTVEFGTNEFANIPISISSPHGRVDLLGTWKQQLELYRKQKEALPPAMFVAPVTRLISDFIVQDFREASYRRYRESGVSTVSDQNEPRYVAINRFEDRVFKVSLAIGAGLSAVGGYLMFTNLLGHSMTPLIVFLSGSAVGLLTFVNMMPEHVSGDRSYLGQLLERWLDHRESSKQRAQLAKFLALEKQHRLEVETAASKRAYVFGNIEIVLSSESITNIKSDAWVVPHFRTGENGGGVLNAIEEAIGQRNASAFERIVQSGEKMPFGSVTVTSVEGPQNTRFLFNAVTVASAIKLELSEADKTRVEFDVIRSALYESLQTASKIGLSSIAVPLMGTGVMGSLRTDSNSMQALFEAIRAFNADFPNAKKIRVTVAAYLPIESFVSLQAVAERAESRGIIVSPHLNAKPKRPPAAATAAFRCESAFSSTP